MSLSNDFDALQEEVNAEEEHVTEARRRRGVILDAFLGEADVTEGLPSGSLARGSQIDPIHDVDAILIFDQTEHPDWGTEGASALEALEDLQRRVQELVGANRGSVAKEVRRADVKNHAVKCFLDDPDDPDAFTVDLMPALRRAEGGLLVPERMSERWIATDPEFLMRAVADRHASWNEFVKLVRVLKRWNRDHGGTFKSLTLEILALEHMQKASRPEALAQFFAAAHVAIDEPICDPAGLCGEVQPGLNRDAARQRLEDAADLSWRALEAEANDDEDEARALWHQALGNAFPKPKDPTTGSGGAGAVGAASAGVVAAPRRPRPVIDAPQG